MEFTRIDMETWERKSHFEYYRNILKCGYSVTAALDMTRFREMVRANGLRLFPAFVYCASSMIEEKKEFRMDVDEEGRPGYYECRHPNYTIFHEDDHTFSDIWTEYTRDFGTFYRNMISDMETYRNVKGVKAKPDQPRNFYCISFVPWLSFTGYSAYTESGEPKLFPIITCGKFAEENGKVTMPFCMNISHAAADGYHTSMFINDLQKMLDTIELTNPLGNAGKKAVRP